MKLYEEKTRLPSAGAAGCCGVQLGPGRVAGGGMQRRDALVSEGWAAANCAPVITTHHQQRWTIQTIIYRNYISSKYTKLQITIELMHTSCTQCSSEHLRKLYVLITVT